MHEYISPKFPNGTKEYGEWVLRPSHGLPAPECRETDWSRDNHLGNGIGGFANTYNWTLPNVDEESCVLRIRYVVTKYHMHCQYHHHITTITIINTISIDSRNIYY